MNCKPGMAVMVKKSAAGNEGRVGTVVEWCGAGEHIYPSGLVNSDAGWHVDGIFKCPIAGEERSGVFPDEWLIPIRDKDGEDQTLTWAGKPSDIKTPEAA